jgi:RNAse (barnase) inhibitor barstar
VSLVCNSIDSFICSFIYSLFIIIGTLSADGWSAHSQSYFALLLHYLDNETLLPITILLGSVKKSKQNAQSLYDETLEILAEWELEKQLELPFQERYLLSIEKFL